MRRASALCIFSEISRGGRGGAEDAEKCKKMYPLRTPRTLRLRVKNYGDAEKRRNIG